MGHPSFLVLGCQKGGTTSLYDLICTHPLIKPAREKELQFFSLHHKRGLDWYRRQFNTRWPQISGEATPYYLFHPLAAQRIAKAYPTIKLIVLLRDPVDRALSQYFHSKRLGLEPLELWEALQAEPQRLKQAATVIEAGGEERSHQEHSYVARSRYSEQLARYQALFPAQQILLLNSASLFKNPQGVTRATWKFLGLPPWFLTQTTALNQGRGEAKQVDPTIRAWLEKQLEHERMNMNLLLDIPTNFEKGEARAP